MAAAASSSLAKTRTGLLQTVARALKTLIKIGRDGEVADLKHRCHAARTIKPLGFGDRRVDVAAGKLER